MTLSNAKAALHEQESRFVAQSEVFLALVRSRFVDAPVSMAAALDIDARPAEPIVVGDLSALTAIESMRISRQLQQGFGVTHVVPHRFEHPRGGTNHPLLSLTRQLNSSGAFAYPVDHPMEGHPEAVLRFGAPDGTLKLYNLPIPADVDKYREVGETNQMFDSHNDGLGYAGLIQYVVMTVDHAPVTGGYTYFQNLVRLAPALAADDPDAFQALFLPDAITAIRPRGKGAIKVTSPVFFIGCTGEPQVFFRVTTGEYRIVWRDHPALARARKFLERMATPFAPQSTFVHFMHPGETAIVANRQVVHGRTEFIEPLTGIGRTLARKWFVERPEHAAYRHVPGMAVHHDWASLFPERFIGEAVQGEWHYDAAQEKNLKIA